MSRYTDLITSNHKTKSKFFATVDVTTQPMLNCQQLLQSIKTGFNIDTAIGAQLDKIGERVGMNRNIPTEVTDVYFSFLEQEPPYVGWQQGIWKNKYDSVTQISQLSDSDYRIMLKAKIIANTWDGTIQTIYDNWSKVFPPEQSFVIVTDNQNMTINIGLIGVTISEIVQQLIIKGYIPLKPAGVAVNFYMAPGINFQKLFAWNQQNLSMDGWGLGYWPFAG